MSDITNNGEEEILESKSQEELEQLKISELSKRGYQLLKEKMITEAEDCFDQILEMDKDNNYALVGLGDAARKKGKFKDAIIYYQRCLDLYELNNYALFGLADCYKALRKFNQAIKIWEQYLVHDSGNITVLTRVADAYRKVKDFRGSKEVYLRVLELEADNPYALIGLGHLHYDFKEFREALHYWERMVEVRSDSIDIRVLTSLGNCHRKLKSHENGLKYFRQALAIEPNNFYALFGLADCYRGLNRDEESLECWQKILKLDPYNKVILTRAGDSYRALGDFDNAEDYYKKALNIEFDAYAILGLALINKEKGNFESAIESLHGLLKNDRKNHRLYTEIAECHLILGQKMKAVEILEEFQKMGIRNIYVTNLMARIKTGQ